MAQEWQHPDHAPRKAGPERQMTAPKAEPRQGRKGDRGQRRVSQRNLNRRAGQVGQGRRSAHRLRPAMRKHGAVCVNADTTPTQHHRRAGVTVQRHMAESQAEMARGIASIQTQEAQQHGQAFPGDRFAGQLGLKMVNACLTSRGEDFPRTEKHDGVDAIRRLYPSAEFRSDPDVLFRARNIGTDPDLFWNET